MLYFFVLLMFAGVVGVAAAVAGMENVRYTQHIGTAMAIGLINMFLLPLVFGSMAMPPGEGWKWLVWLVQAAFAWLAMQLLSRLFYTADGRQALTMSTVTAVGWFLLSWFWDWALST
jgi:hypothetical protein